ncbi:hypothetical protein NQ318_021151 [Aromia moschata]|uniref:Uncharacterized protein n=1 Tax=Aromia moschata TaxID=1265417 RepID=A0AAV8YHL7_9CUCU|nr:hypothetical protein NQ318_021151 [Aromia moschata]
MKKRDISHKSHPGLDALKNSNLCLPEKRLKYEKLAVKKRKRHPEVPRIVKVAKVKPDKTPKHPKSPKPPKPAKEKSPPKPPKERIPKRPPPPFQYFYLSELEKERCSCRRQNSI